MTDRVKLPARPIALLAGPTRSALAVGWGTSDGPGANQSPTRSTGGASGSTSASSTRGAGIARTGTGGVGTSIGEGGVPSDDKRVVRRSFNQISRTIAVLSTIEKFNRNGAAPLRGLRAKPA
jgi:hypothetical protein